MGSIEEFTREAWAVRPVLDVPGLTPPAVLFSLLDFDPLPKFRDHLQRISDKSQQQGSNPNTPLSRRLLRQSQLSVAWDSIFHEVPGDRMALLFQNQEGPESQQGTPEGSASAGPVYTVMIKSNSPLGSKWLVTRSTHLKDHLVCWSIRLELEAGKTSKVSLTADNMTVLEPE